MFRFHTHLKKPDLPWGFSIYRCTYKGDKAWERILQLIHHSVQKYLREGAPELTPHHQLVINDDVTKFDGATSHEIRDHYNVWVEEQLPLVASSPERLHMFEGAYVPPEYPFGARFNYALFVDDICLESLDHMMSPVVKILYKQWGNLTPDERNYKIHPDWHDGTTEVEEEDVGWMYMSAAGYVELYDKCEWSNLDIWYTFYLRPPLIEDQLSERWGTGPSCQDSGRSRNRPDHWLMFTLEANVTKRCVGMSSKLRCPLQHARQEHVDLSRPSS
jgi:hypothetical protein